MYYKNEKSKPPINKLPLLKKRYYVEFNALIFMGSVIRDFVVLITKINFDFFAFRYSTFDGFR